MKKRKRREARKAVEKKKSVARVFPVDYQFPERMLNEEAAAFLRISPATLTLWRCKGSKVQIPYSKVGGRIVYLLSDLRQFLESTRRTQTA